MALNAHAKDREPYWQGHVDALMRECKIDSTAKMAKLLTDVRWQGT
jgi:hypothetical protein